MIRSLAIGWTIVLLMLQTKARGQYYFQLNADSLDYFFQKKDLVDYFKKIRKLSIYAADSLKDQVTLDSIGNLLFRDFGILQASEKSTLRNASTMIAALFKTNFGNYNKALQYYLLAHDHIADPDRLANDVWLVENQILTIYTMKGDYEKATYYGNIVERNLLYRIHISEKDTPSVMLLSRFYANRAIQKDSEGKRAESFQDFLKGYHLADSIHFDVGVSTNAMGLASYYLDSSQYVLSKKYLDIVDKILPEIKKDPHYIERSAYFLLLSAQYDFNTGTSTQNINLVLQSIPLFKHAIQTLGEYYDFKKRREFAKFYIPLAEAYLSLDSFPQAELNVNLGLSSIIPDYTDFETSPDYNQIYPENSFNELFLVQSKIYQREYVLSKNIEKLKKAISSVDLGLTSNDLLRHEIIGDPSRLISVADNKSMIHEALEITFKLYTLTNDTFYLGKARELFNRSKSILLDEKIKKLHLLDLIPLNDSILLEHLQSANRELYDLKFEEGINLDSVNHLILENNEHINSTFNKYAQMLHPVSLQGDYIEYSVHGDDVFVLSEISGHRQFAKLGKEKELKKLLVRMDDFIRLRELSDDKEVLAKLYDFLLKPVLSILPSHLTIIPDGEISFIPFEMLKDNSGKSIISKCTVSYAYEFESYRSTHPNTKRAFDIFCMAPEYKNLEKKSPDAIRGSLYQLPFAQAEADSIRNLFGPDALMRNEENKQDLADEMIQSHIFHFAGHAIVNKDDAYLAVGGEENKHDHWTQEEIGQLRKSADLVVLSACETGLGKMEMGEGIRSLGRSFMESGASATIMSLWNVNDKSTSAIMNSFYKYLRSGQRIDEALRNAKLNYISKAGSGERHPYFWAAFIPAGNMNPIQWN